MITRIGTSALLLVFALFCSTEGWAQEEESTPKLKLAAGKVGAASHMAGLVLDSVSKFDQPGNAPLYIAVENTTGYEDSLSRLQRGEVDFAISDSVLAHLARTGTSPFSGQPHGELRSVAALWHEVEHVMVREDRVKSGTITDLRQIEPRHILYFDPESGGSHSLNYIFSRLDQGPDAPLKFSQVREPKTAAQAIGTGWAGALYLTSAGGRSPFAETLYGGTGPGWRMLEFSALQVETMADGVPVWVSHEIAAGTYPGQNQPLFTAARAVLLVARADVADSAVYSTLDKLHRNRELFQGLTHDPLLSKALEGLSLPLHPGALRYFRDAGKLPQDLQAVPDPAALAKFVRSGSSVAASVLNVNQQAGNEAYLTGQPNRQPVLRYSAQATPAGTTNAGTPVHVGSAAHNGEAAHKGHIHDPDMIARSKMEIHDGKWILKVGRPDNPSPEARVFVVYFGLGESGLDEGDEQAVVGAAQFILDSYARSGQVPAVYVEGHTDRTGDWRQNYDLAYRRALNVKQALAATSVRSDWIHIADYSEDRAKVRTADGVEEQLNRRVEILVEPRIDLTSQAAPAHNAGQHSAGKVAAPNSGPRSVREAELIGVFQDWIRNENLR